MDIYLLLVIALVLFATKSLSILTLRLHLPQVVGALAAGILLGPAVFGLVEPNEVLSSIADMGVLILLFSAGMETDFRELRHSLKSSTLIAVMGIAVSLAFGFGVALLIFGPSMEAFFIGVIIASTSTSITVEALHELGKLKTKSGTAIMGTAVVDDILGIIILALILGMVTGDGFSGFTIGLTLVRIVGFFIFAIICGMGINKLFNYMYDKFGERRRLSIFALAFCFIIFSPASTTGGGLGKDNFLAEGTLAGSYATITSRIGLRNMFFKPFFLILRLLRITASEPSSFTTWSIACCISTA